MALMTSWWSCPRCGQRLKWLRTSIICPNQRCGYVTPVPTPVATE